MGALACVECGATAAFLVPAGLMCAEHAVRAAEDLGNEEEWIPVPVKNRIVAETTLEVSLEDADSVTRSGPAN